MAPLPYGPSYNTSHHTSNGGPSSAAGSGLNQAAPHESMSPRQNPRPGGLNTTTVVGALLGAAAGAAVTYGLVSGSRESPREHDGDIQHPPGLYRRSTYPDRPVTGENYSRKYRDHTTGIVEPGTSHKLPRPRFQGHPTSDRYNDGDEDGDYGIERVAQPRYPRKALPFHDHAHSGGHATVRQPDGIPDGHSQRTSRASARQTSRVRARSETSQGRVPSAMSDWALRSPAAPRRGSVQLSEVPRPPVSRSHHSHRSPDLESYGSSRSRRSSSTVRGVEREHQTQEKGSASRGRPPSRISDVTPRERSREVSSRAPSHTTARGVPLPRSLAGSSHAHWDPHEVPLPRSKVGSSHAHWDPWDIPLPRSGVGSSHAGWDDDLDSLAPSDSISCVGSKSSRRGHKKRR